ncbi:MAG: CDP-alcohol phosphatidyltransferase family protein [Rhodospirillaceae bacterium]|nr:MAG: CDP-alcohol phosphatidyltransferase family protein [Rhodospirillaceae bacterium]
MDNNKEIKRTIEIEEFTNRYLIHPISGRLVPLLHRLDVHPNTVSLTGALCGAIAALCYFNYDNRHAAIAGLIFMLGWHVLDGADGQLARLSGKVTASGYVIDGICDYTTFILVYVALALRMSASHGTGMWIIVVMAGMSHMVQAAAFELQRASYNKWISGKALADDMSRDKPRDPSAGALSGMARIYALAQRPFRPIPDEIGKRLRTFGLSNADQAAEAYRKYFRRGVLRWSWLSANNHTIAIFVACYLGYPTLYFLFEIFALNAALVFLVRMNRAQAESLSGWLAVNGG